MSIGKISFGQLMQQCGDLVDNKTLKITDLDIAYIQVKAADAKKQNKLVPADQLVRHNFLEIMIRIADQKFIKSGLCHSYQEALEELISKYLKPVFMQTDSGIWRTNVLYKEENDLALKRQ